MRKKIIAPRGPRRDLCVVVVTISECSNGEGITPAATIPEICAISVKRYAPTFFAIPWKRGYQIPSKKISKISEYFETLPYRLDIKTGLIDYDSLEASTGFDSRARDARREGGRDP